MNINCKGKLIDLSTPKVMGILNMTPDSFYDGGTLKSDRDVIGRTEKMLTEGATFIDVGGYSSKPNAKDVSEVEESQRVIPIIKLLVKNFPEILVSIDTFRSVVAKKAIEAGASMVNDISAGNLDENMFTTVRNLQVPYIIMHMQGTPKTMQIDPTYADVTKDIVYYFSDKLNTLRKLGLNDIIIDVGFGFGKTLEQNYELLNNLELFKNLEVPILAGVSRKSMLYNLLGTTPQKALNATTVANTIAVLYGSNILRVHDVNEALEAIKVVEALRE
ncbi:dihydropteroate synthase [Aureibaculum sp. 2210JD6-5]|uniref:dihydropteroate synthase n=1 Tax=Aureibaculum sp. 2210JD6-5 TaxID=3103957 RepID=UPI002AAC90B7|nr:dihydropteroate synthase [Aureibaculum sp. 2210JD6-5]MDY7394439.1 dihydropteroate synthase [Aureibaculum sp. 2210JD6-5]